MPSIYFMNNNPDAEAKNVALIMAKLEGMNEKPRTEAENQALIAKLKEEHYNRDHYDNAAEQEADMQLLLSLIKNLGQNGDNEGSLNFKSQHDNNISVSAGGVSGNIFQKGPDDSPENINAALEVIIAAKATFEGDAGMLGGHYDYNDEQMAIMLYAAERAGFTILDKPEGIEISQELKNKMDPLCDQMLVHLGLAEAPTQAMGQDQEVDMDNVLKPASLQV